MKGYTNISIPSELYQELIKMIRSHPELGYKTMAEFVKESLRIRMNEIKKSK